MPSTKEFECDLCSKVFTRPKHLKQHRGGKYCKARARKELESCVKGKVKGKVKDKGKGTGKMSRIDSIKRTISRNITGFASFLKSTVRRQMRAKRRTAVGFIPYGTSKCITKDYASCAAIFETSARQQEGNVNDDAKLVRLMSTAVAGAYLWTDRWLQMLGLLPAAWGTRVHKRLERALWNAWEREEQFVNVQIQCMASRSILKSSRSEAKAQIASILGVVEGAVERAPGALAIWKVEGWAACVQAMSAKGQGLPAHGYSLKFFEALLQHAGVRGVHADDVTGFTSTHIASSALQGIATLTGEDVGVYKSCPGLAEMRLVAIQEAVEGGWPKRGLRFPGAGVADTQAQLCSWVHNEYPTESADYDHTMNAACLLEKL